MRARCAGCARILGTVSAVRSHLAALRGGRRSEREWTEAWDGFYRVFRPLVQGLVREAGPPEGELDDWTQEAWLHVILKLDRFICESERGDFADWLRVLVRRVLIDRRRRRRGALLLLGEAAESLPGAEADPAVLYELSRARRQVRLAMAQVRRHVARENYQIVMLRWMRGYSIAEIAHRLRMSPAQVRFRHHRTIRRMRSLLLRHDPLAW